MLGGQTRHDTKVAQLPVSAIRPLHASSTGAATPVVALVGLRAQSRKALTAALRVAIPSCETVACDALEQFPADGARASPALAVIDADSLAAGLLATLQMARQRLPKCRLVVLAAASGRADIERVVKAGAMTYLPKHYTAAQRELVLRLAWTGAGHLPWFVPDGRPDGGARPWATESASPPIPPAPALANTLTPKQNEVLSYLAEGKSNLEIAQRLRITVGTVKLHVTEILRKLEVDSRGQAMRLAHRLEQVQRHMVAHGQDGSLVLDGLMSHASHRQYRNGEVIFRKGDLGGELFYVQRGTVHLDEIGEDMGPGDIFGEIGVFSPERARTSTARCKTDVDLFCLDAEKAKQVYVEAPHFALRIATLLAQRLVAERAHL